MAKDEGLAHQREANARLTRGDVVKVRELSREGHSARAIAQAYGVGIETIRRVLRGDTWAWLIEGTGTPAALEQQQRVIEESRTALERLLERDPSLVSKE